MRLEEKDWLQAIQERKLPHQFNEHNRVGWKASFENGVDPYRKTIPHHDNSRNGHQELPCWMEPIVKDTIEPHLKLTEYSPLAWMLFSADAKLTKVYTHNTELKDYFAEYHITPGADFSIQSTGNHSLSLAIKKQCLTFCGNYGNFLKILHPFRSVSSPLFGLDGKVYAYLSIFTSDQSLSHTSIIEFLRLAIQSFESRIRLKRSIKRNKRLTETLESLITEDHEPTMMVSSKGFLKQINPAAIELLELQESLTESEVDKLAKFKPSIREIATRAIVDQDIPLEIQLPNKTLQVTASRTPCYSQKDQFIGIILSMTEKSREKTEGSSSPQEARHTFQDIIGKTPAILNAKTLAQQVAQTPISVLLTGESGTGKEMFAQSIHNASPFGDGPFISLNCATIPPDIAESELFGYAKGTFTGALKQGKPGILESAHNGTLFLDEIGEMPLEIQVKFLRVLEDQVINRLGESQTKQVRFRLIAATNQNLQDMIAEKKFREDLYYRIAVSSIRLPALRDSFDDIPTLFLSFVEYFNEQMRKKVTEVSETLLQKLKAYPWKGNIRELRNAAEFAVMVNSGNEKLTLEHMPGDMRMALLYSQEQNYLEIEPLQEARQQVDNSERELILTAIDKSQHNAEEAARLLGVSRATFYRRIKKHGLTVKR